MKNKIIIANWKMQLSSKEAEILIKEILSKVKDLSRKYKNERNPEIVICPSFTNLERIVEIGSKKNFLSFGGQNCFWEAKGGFTGEISPLMLKEAGCRYVIIGHSERRKFLNETDEMVHKKVRAALEMGLTPIICIGETWEEREKGLKDQVIINQIAESLEEIKLQANQKIIIAYEPVWIVNPGQSIDPGEMEYIVKVILQKMIDLYPLPVVRNNIRVIYGGSIDTGVLMSFLERKTIDGVLVGSASLRAEEFVKMCQLIFEQSAREK